MVSLMKLSQPIWCSIKHESKVRSTDGDTDFFDIAAGVLQGEYISPIFVYNLCRLRTLKVNRSNERKLLYTKVKKQTISLTLYYGQTLCRWISAFCKYPYLSWMPAKLSEAGSRWHWLPCECRYNWLHMF